MYSTSLSQKKSDGTTGPLKHLLDLRAEVYYVYKDAPDSLITADKLLTSSM